MEHWQLSDMESVDSWPLDYRVSDPLKDCATIFDVKKLLTSTYSDHVTAEFSHVTDEDERLWLYENYELIMSKEEVSASERVKAL